MFAVTINPSDLKAAFKSVAALVDECKMHVDENGVTVTAVDPANVAMVDMSLPESVFQTYEADQHTIGLPLERFLDIITLFTKDSDGEPARIFLQEDTRELRLECGGLDYTLSLIDPDSVRQEPDIPDLELAANVTMQHDDFNHGIRACNMVSDHLVFGVDEDSDDVEFYIEAEGDTDDVKVALNDDDCIELNPGEAQSMFSIDYLTDMDQAIPSNKPVTLEIGREFPLLITFNLLDNAGNTLYMLAPRINSD